MEDRPVSGRVSAPGRRRVEPAPVVWGLVACALVAWGLVSCARQAAPPGGPPDRLPPLVVGTEPDTFAVVEGGRRTVRIRFSERISERSAQGALDDAVRVSPQTGQVRVEHDSRALGVTVQGGFRAGLVYRVLVLPVVQDLFSNTMSEPFELVFSTGGELHPTLLAGRVVDRITGEPVRGGRVTAIPDDDSLVHVAVADSAGIFALRFLPPGRYRVQAFLDQNRNDSADFAEVQAVQEARLQAGDTLLLEEVALLRPDTTPAVLTGVEVRDPVSLRLGFDDYLDPEEDLTGVEVRIDREEGQGPQVAGVFHEEGLEAALQARADSLAGIAAEAEAREAPPEEPEEGPPLPARALFVLVRDSLAPEATYVVEVGGVRNIAGVPGGGGVDTIRVPVREVADTVPADSLGVPPDTAAAPPDTASPPDTAGASPDTLGRTRPAPPAAAPRPRVLRLRRYRIPLGGGDP